MHATIKSSKTTSAAVGNIFKLLTIALCCCSCCYVNCEQQQQQQEQPQHPHKYKQLQYQIQQQQHYDYKQQMQQHQQQHYYMQQYQQQQQHQQQQQQQQQQDQQQQHQQQQKQPLQQQQQKQDEMHEQHLPPLQPQMLRTGASLVVDDGRRDGGSTNGGDRPGGEPLSPMRRKPAMRKRKRRPQAGVAAHDTEYWRGHVADERVAATSSPSPSPTPTVRDDAAPNLKTRRRKQPAIREPLAALEKEQQLYEMRDKQRKEFSSADKSYRRPYSQAKKDLQAPTTTDTVSNAGGSADGGGDLTTVVAGERGTVDLKNILKHAGGGMSLSEILQQKNLSLDDLLKGKQNALLALQTTAAAPAPPTDAVRNNKPLRKTAPMNGFVADAPSDSGELTPHNADNADDPLAKNKLKFPALQRLKLFGSSSRGTTATLTTHQSGADATTARRRDSTTSTTSTAAPAITTRIPLYKKRLQQRPTLKPSSLLKVPASATSTAATKKEIPTSAETLTTTHQRQDSSESQADGDHDDFDLEQEVKDEEITDGGDASRMHETPSSKAPDRTAETTTIVTTTTWLAASSQSSKDFEESQPPRGNGERDNLTLQQDSDNNSIERDQRGPPTKFTSYTTANEAENTQDNDNDNDDDLQNFFEESHQKEPSSFERAQHEDSVESITARADHFATRPAREDIDTLPDLDGVDDRTDLLELIEDRGSGNRLFKVLEQRNMTLEELIEHRKRGSSQLHLSTIVQNRSRFFPGQKVVLHDNMDIVTAFENFPHFNLLDLKSVKPDDIKTDSQGSSYFTSIIDIEPTDEVYKSGAGETGLRGPAYLPPQRTEKSIGFFPSWKTLALASLATTTRDAATKRNPFYLAQPKMLLENTDSQELDVNDDDDDDDKGDDGDDDDVDLTLGNETRVSLERQPAPHRAALDTVEIIENEVARAHDLLDLELSGHGFKRSPAAAAASMAKQQHGSAYAHMPAGIRSAIVASAAIVITSLATFMVIFVVCRWKQRRRRRTNYMKTYNAMKSKLPTVTSASRRSSLRHLETIGDLATISSGSLHQQHSEQHQQQHHHHNHHNHHNQQHHQLQRQSSLLFTRRNSDTTAATAVLVGSSGGGGNSSCINASLSGHGGIGSATGSTTSLALSLRSAHNISATKLNTMDPNSPEVQEYLFDALRNSF